MQQTFQISGHSVTVSRDNQENSFVSRQLHFINEVDATFYMPWQEGIFIHEAQDYLSYLHQHYDALRVLAFKAIGAKAFADGRWGKQLSDNPKMDLVWAKVLPESYQGNGTFLELAFNDAIHDVYGLWITSFKEDQIVGVRRQAW